MRRCIALAGALVLLLAATCGSAVAVEGTSTPETTTPAPLFSMDAYAQARAGVDSHAWSDPVAGVGGYVTRGELAILLAQRLGLEDSTACYYSDVIGPEDCFGAVGALHDAELLTGSASSYFHPDSPVSRQQALVWIVDALCHSLSQETDSTVPIRLSYFDPAARWLDGFSDRGMVSDVLERGVANAYRLGLVDPAEGGELYPAFPLSQDELDDMLDRAFSKAIVARTASPDTVTAEMNYATLELKSEGPLVWHLECQLAALKYRPGPIDGVFDVRTRDAVYAFQKVEELKRDGVVGESFWTRLAVAETPEPRLDKEGARVEVDLGRQVLFMIKDNQVTKIVHVSSGKSKTATLWGHFEVEKKIERWLHDSYNTTMYYSSFFDVDHRLAFHGYSEVPTWPASHGCVRTPIWMAKELYEEMPMGTHVYIYR